MKWFASILVVVLVSVSFAETNLSQKITSSRPWSGTCAPLNGEFSFRLTADLRGASCAFRHLGRSVSGYFVAGEVVFCRKAETIKTGDWYQITRAVRCGNPSTGRFFVPRAEPCRVAVAVRVEVEVKVILEKRVECVRVVEVEKPVEVTRFLAIPTASPIIFVPMVIDHDRVFVVGQTRTVTRDIESSGAVIGVPVEVDHDRVFVVDQTRTETRDIESSGAVIGVPVEVDHDRVFVVDQTRTEYRLLPGRSYVVERPVVIQGYIPPPGIMPNCYVPARQLNLGWSTTNHQTVVSLGVGWLPTPRSRPSQPPEIPCPEDGQPFPDPIYHR